MEKRLELSMKSAAIEVRFRNRVQRLLIHDISPKVAVSPATSFDSWAERIG